MQRYTLAQIEAFLGALGDDEKADRRTALILARAAQADKKGFERMLKELR